jgi:hypothetical protein
MERQHLKKMLSVHSLTQLKPNFEKNLKSIKTDIRKNNELLTPQNDNENMNNMYKDKSIRNKFIESHRKMLYNLNITFESQKSSLNIKNTHNQELEIAKEKQKLKLFGIISKFKKVIIIQILIVILDFILITFFPKIFFNFFNIFSLLLLLFFSFYVYKEFVEGFEKINKNCYKNIKNILYLTIIIMIVFFAIILYEIVVQILIFNLPDFEVSEILKWIFFILLYSLINITIPVLLLIHLYEIKNNIKIFGKLEGKDYSVASE